MKTKLFLFATAVLLFGVMTAYAHHSFVGTYATNEIKLDGKLVGVLFRNPHVFIHIDVTDENGMPQRWALEWAGTSALANQAVTRDTFKAGDHLVITGNPSRTNGERRVKVNTIRRPEDGFTWGLKPGEKVE